MNIQWYPGHMTKSKRMMQESIVLVDIVIELLDARVPYSSKNPDIDTLSANKKRIVVLNKSDLADMAATKKWESHFAEKGFGVVITDSQSGKGVADIEGLSRELMRDKIESQRKRGRIFVPIRAMIVGIPNVGKSTLINRYVGRASTKTGDKPGVTRGKQWVKIKKDFELLDTPGILWPKFDDPQVGLHLALTGAIHDEIMDRQGLSLELIRLVGKIKPHAFKERYKIECDTADPSQVFIQIGEARGFKIKGGEVDTERTAIMLLDEFRGGKLGRISLETPDDYI